MTAKVVDNITSHHTRNPRCGFKVGSIFQGHHKSVCQLLWAHTAYLMREKTRNTTKYHARLGLSGASLARVTTRYPGFPIQRSKIFMYIYFHYFAYLSGVVVFMKCSVHTVMVCMWHINQNNLQDVKTEMHVDLCL